MLFQYCFLHEMPGPTTIKHALIPMVETFGFVLAMASPFFAYQGYHAWSDRVKAETNHQKQMRDIALRKATAELQVIQATAEAVRKED